MFQWSSLYTEIKQSIRIGLPLVIAELIYAINSFLATAMIAHLSKEQLAANALVWSIYLAISVFFLGIICSSSVLISQSFGAQDRHSVAIIFKQGLIMALIFSIPMMLLLYLSPMLLVLTQQDPNIIRYARPFLYSLMLPSLPLLLISVIQQFLVGINRVRLVTVMSLIAVPIELGFFYLFLFGWDKFGLPARGLPGIGYGLTVSYTLLSIFFILYLSFHSELKKYHLFQDWWIVQRKFFLEMVRVGLPLGTMWCSELVFFSIIAIMMGCLGVNILAAFQIANQYLMLAIVILFGLGQATTIRVGYEVGRGNKNRIILSTFVNIGLGIGLLALFTIFYVTNPELAIQLDVDIHSAQYQTVIQEATKFLPLVAIILLTDSVRIIFSSALRGLKDVNFQLGASILGYWLIAFPLAYLSAFKLHWGGSGIWWSIIIGLLINGIVLAVRTLRLIHKLNFSGLVTKR